MDSDTQKIQILIAICSVAIGVLLRPITDKYITPALPESATLARFFKAAFLLLLKYVMPVYFLISAFKDDDFNKSFILKVLIMCSALFVALLIDASSMLLRGYRREIGALEKSIRDKSKLRD